VPVEKSDILPTRNCHSSVGEVERPKGNSRILKAGVIFLEGFFQDFVYNISSNYEG